MTLQDLATDTQTYKLIFSQIKCKIHLKHEALLGLVIRVGKLSSKYTNQLLNSSECLQFPQTLEVPFDKGLLEREKSSIRQKCEIMLYKFKRVQSKESKELIGMASINMGCMSFENSPKKIRLTNSYDKQANIQCHVKIELGEADAFCLENSRVSSIYLKSEIFSNQELGSARSEENDRKHDATGNRAVKFKNKVLKKQSEDDSLLEFIEQNNERITASRYSCSSPHNNPSEYFSQPHPEVRDEKSFDLISNLQEQIDLLNSKLQDSQQEIVQIKQNKKRVEMDVIEEVKYRNQKLQQQNKELINKLEKLEKSTDQTHESQKQSEMSSKEPQENSRLSDSNSKSKSPQIRKNIGVVVPNNLKLKGQFSSHSANQMPNSTFKEPQKVIRSDDIHSLLNINMQSIMESENENSPLRGRNSHLASDKYNRSHVKNTNENELQVSAPLTGTFGGRKQLKLQIRKYINIMYEPPVRKNQHVNQSLSYDEGISHSRSYTKFRPVNKFGSKHKLIGSVKQSSNGVSFIGSEGVASNGNHIKQKVLNFNLADNLVSTPMDNDSISQVGVPDYKASSAVNLKFTDFENRDFKDRVTLEILNEKTDHIRKAEMFLRKANEKLTADNKQTVEKMQGLSKELKDKKFVNIDEQRRMKDYILKLEGEIADLKNSSQSKDVKIKELTNKYEIYLRENNQLKKKMKAQKEVIKDYRKSIYQMDEAHKDQEELIQQSSKTYLRKDSGLSALSGKISAIDHKQSNNTSKYIDSQTSIQDRKKTKFFDQKSEASRNSQQKSRSSKVVGIFRKNPNSASKNLIPPHPSQSRNTRSSGNLMDLMLDAASSKKDGIVEDDMRSRKKTVPSQIPKSFKQLE